MNIIVVVPLDAGLPNPWDTVFDYIGIYCLRNYGFIDGHPCHQQIYVHSKAMIVDNRIAIIGSANINDRSQLGDRDTELAAIIQDERRVKIKFDGSEMYARQFAHELRKRLCAEHLGLTDRGDSIADFAKGFELIKETATKNTEVYEEIFPDIPSNRIRTLGQQDNTPPIASGITLEQAKQKLDSQVKGHITIYPLKWLFEQELYSRTLLLQNIYVHNEQAGSKQSERTG